MVTLLTHSPSSLDDRVSSHAPASLLAVASAGWRETNLKYFVHCEWALVTFEFIYDFSDLLAAMLAAMLCRGLRRFAQLLGLAPTWFTPCLSGVSGISSDCCDIGRCLCGLVF